MEKDPILLSKERNISRAEQLAYEALRGYANSFTEYITSVLDNSSAEREDLVSDFYVQTAIMTEAGERLRERRIVDFRDRLGRKIDSRGLDSDHIEQVEISFNEKLRLLMNNEDETTKVVRSSQQESDQRVGVSNEDHQRLLANKANEYTERVTASIEQSSLNNLAERVSRLSGEFESSCDHKMVTLYDLVQNKLINLRNLIAHKDGSQTSLISRYETSIDDLIKRLQASGATTKSRSKGNKDSSDNSQKNGFNSQGANNRSERQPKRDPRIDTLAGKQTGYSRRPYAIVLANIDHHRNNGKSDEQIYKLRIRNFHPDRSTHDDREDISRVLIGAYDRKTKSFKV